MSCKIRLSFLYSRYTDLDLQNILRFKSLFKMLFKFSIFMLNLGELRSLPNVGNHSYTTPMIYRSDVASAPHSTKETLKWVHIAISNAKRTLLGNYYKIKRKYLQLYLNEFIYKLNRRCFGDKLFDRLVIANITGA